jgi:RNA polymerase sigma factor (sigma-70 family)
MALNEHDLASAMLAQQARLIRLCILLTGDPAAAEDLAAETFVEAWRNRHKLYDPQGLGYWLSAIARNVCRRWLRQQAKIVPTGRDEEDETDGDGELLEAEFERHECLRALEQMLAFLPADTREILIEHYVNGRTHSEIAARMGMRVDAVAMRISRGKTYLRKRLTPDDATSVGQVWSETSIWCPACGCRRLMVCCDQVAGNLSFRCLGCNPERGINHSDMPLKNPYFAQMIGGIKRYKTLWNRTANWTHTYFRQRVVNCTCCGHESTLQPGMPEQASASVRQQRGLHVRCDVCGSVCSVSLTGLVLALPAVRQFWQANPRMRMLPNREIEAGILTTFQSVTHGASVEVISSADHFDLIGIHTI